MPGIKSILAVASAPDSGPSVMQAAFSVGRRMQAHVTVLHVRPDPSSAVPYVGEAMAGALVEEMMEAAERDAQARAEATRAAFDALVSAQSVPLREDPPAQGALSAAFRIADGSEPDVVAGTGRLADLIVAGRPNADAEQPALETLNAALMEAGRTVLMVPGGATAGLGANIAIAWNGSPEAARAVHGAMPFLDLADAVTILYGPGDDGGDADALARYLAWHGINAETAEVRGHQGHELGQSLLKHCDQRAVDLLVMGAYTHSRLRQLILGGVTRHVIEHATIPVLSSH